MLEVLTGDPSPADMPQEGCLLYCCSNRVEFTGQMPPFDDWGLRPVGLEGPRENPVSVASLPAASMELTPEVGAGGRAVSNAGDAAVAESALLDAPEAPSPRARDRHPGETAEGTMQLAAPKAEAPEALASCHEAEAEKST